ncbi:Ubiquitin C-terminal hydrolase 12 [Linum grandiflorum]
MAKENSPGMKKDTKKFTWRIENFSKLETLKLYSDTFVAGSYKWRVLVFPKGNNVNDLSVYLDFADKDSMPSGWSVSADFILTLVGQLTGSSCLQMSATNKFEKDKSDWGFTSFVPIGDLSEKGYLVNDTLIIQAKVSTEEKPSSDVASTDEPKVIETDQASEAIKVDSLAKSNRTTSSSYLSPSSVQLTSRNLMAELSTMSASPNSSIAGDGSGVLLQKQREKLVGFLDMSLEAVSQSKSLDEVESIIVKILKQTTDSLEKAVLNDLVSRMAEFKELVPSSLSTIETSHDVESSVTQMIKELEVRLVHRKGQLASLEAEIARLEEQGMKLEAEIQQLTARNAKILHHKNATAVELDKANEEASKELEEWKKQHAEKKEAVEKRMTAKDKLAQANASWKLFKENLGWQQQH